MPTASPIIVASIGVVEPMSVKAVIAVMPVMPRPTPNIAESTGTPAATRDPKVRTRTSSATPMPISSDVPPTSGTAPVMPAPLASTCSPPSRASAMTSLVFSTVPGSTSATVSTSKFHVIVPTRPSSVSGESAAASALAASTSPPDFFAAPTTCARCAGAASTGLTGAGSVGSLPSGIWGSAARSATSASTCLRFCGSESFSPFGAATTTLTEAWSKASVAFGKSSACRSAARSEGMPGIEKESLIGFDMVAATVPTPAIAISQAARNSGQRR